MPGTILLMLATFSSGALNAVAGGGAFITFPALLFATTVFAVGAKRVDPTLLKTLVVLIGAVLTLYFFAKGA